MHAKNLGVVVLFGFALSGCDRGRYEISAGDDVVYRLDKQTGEVCPYKKINLDLYNPNLKPIVVKGVCAQ